MVFPFVSSLRPKTLNQAKRDALHVKLTWGRTGRKPYAALASLPWSKKNLLLSVIASVKELYATFQSICDSLANLLLASPPHLSLPRVLFQCRC